MSITQGFVVTLRVLPAVFLGAYSTWCVHISTRLANIHVCVYIHVFPAEFAVQNVVDFFVSTYHESVDTTFSYVCTTCVMSIFRGFVVTLRVLPTAFYTPPFHVYVFVYHSRFSWADFGGNL